MSSMKSSGIDWTGNIPEDWSISRIKYICSSKNSSIATEEIEDSGNYPVYGAAGIMGYSIKPAMTTDYLGVIKDGAGAGRVGKYNANSSLLGTMSYIMEGQSTDRNWLFYVLSLVDLGATENTTTIPHVYFSEYGRKFVPIPTVSEQRAIADLLDEKTGTIIAAIELLKQQVETLESYKRSLIQETVTKGLDPTAPMKPCTIGGISSIPCNWRQTKFKYLEVSFEAGTSVRAASYPALDNEIGVLSLSAVFEGKFSSGNNKAVDPDEISRASCPIRKDTLLVSRCNTAEWVGIPAIADDNYPNLFLPDKIWQIDLGSSLINKFFWYFLRSPYARSYCKTVCVGSSETMQNIASSDIHNFMVVIPSSNYEMSKIVDFLDRKCTIIDKTLATKREQIELLNKQRQSLIYEYVTGKRRVQIGEQK